MYVILWNKSTHDYLSLKNVESIDISHRGKYYLIGSDMYSFEYYELESVTNE